jgi:anaerobic magnesium-protoporphyrin IX monomethyl ester cyclase
MARVVILQRTTDEWLGVMYLSSMLKSRGHHCELFVEPMERRGFLDKVLAGSPDIVAFSCLTSDFVWAANTAAEVKRRSRALVVVGGTHVSLNPEESIAEPGVDIICRGEGEHPLAELAAAVDGGRDPRSIPNLWVKADGRVFRNEVRDLTDDLDSLPLPDRSLYLKYPHFRMVGKRPLHLGRGCPYDCTYCHNVRKKALYRGKGKLVRWRSMDSILAEVEDIRRAGFVKVLHFIDDGFGINRDWLKTFLGKLAGTGEPRLAVQANMRADMVTDDLCAGMAAYGADKLRLRIAVECADEDYRTRVLKKQLTNESLLRATETFRRHGIEFITYNMFGLPGETLDQALETLRLNLRLRPWFAISFIFQPYPGTDLARYALDNGYLSPERLKRLGTSGYEGFYHSRSILTQPDIRRSENVHHVFSLVVNHPFLFPLARWSVRFRILALPLQLARRISIFGFLARRMRRDAY